MNVQEALDTLRSLGTEQNRKIYRRHGAGEDVYGVSFAHLKDLKKKIKTDHELAVAAIDLAVLLRAERPQGVERFLGVHRGLPTASSA
jgi:3-methyladenine DNA glycosylase AlkD